MGSECCPSSDPWLYNPTNTKWRGLPCQVTPVLFFVCVCVFLVLRASLVLRFICWIFGWPFKLFWSIIWEVWKLPESKWNQIHPRVVANILSPQIGGFLVVEDFHFGSIFSGEPAGLVCGWVIDSRHRAFTTVPGWHGPWAIKHVGSVQRFSVVQKKMCQLRHPNKSTKRITFLTQTKDVDIV